MSAQFPSVRLAATVILLRGEERGFSVLMLRRSASSSFVPDVFVFPGGAIEPIDFGAAPLWNAERIRREFRAVPSTMLPIPEPPATAEQAHALVRAAIRELREEASITIDPRDLHLFSHWITPPSERRRYNTYFFIARAPAGQEGVADAIETHDAQWIDPGRALERDPGDFSLVYPTIKHLERLAAFRNADEAIAFAQTKPIVTIMPAGSREDGFAMPAPLEGSW